MTLQYLLNECMQEDVLTDLSRHQLLTALVASSSKYPFRPLFEALITKRRKMVETQDPHFLNSDLNAIYQSDTYTKLVKQGGISTSVADMSLNAPLEKLAIKHFGSLSQMWAHAELMCITQRQLNISTPSPDICFSDDNYDGQLIDDIAFSSLVVTSPYKSGLFSLRDAICLANIELFIIEQKWYEILPLIHQSLSGKHFILLNVNRDSAYPCLVSSAMITDWSQKEHWLSFKPFFQHNKWRCELTDQSLEHINATGVFNSFPYTPNKTDQFDRHCLEHAQEPQAICEILRLSTAGSNVQRLYLLYLAQKIMASCLNARGYRCAYTIIDNPWLLNFYYQLGQECYINTGSYSINQQSSATFRGMWLVERFNFKYSSIDFRLYKKMAKGRASKGEVSDV